MLTRFDAAHAIAGIAGIVGLVVAHFLLLLLLRYPGLADRQSAVRSLRRGSSNIYGRRVALMKAARAVVLWPACLGVVVVGEAYQVDEDPIAKAGAATWSRPTVPPVGRLYRQHRHPCARDRQRGA